MTEPVYDACCPACEETLRLMRLLVEGNHWEAARIHRKVHRVEDEAHRDGDRNPGDASALVAAGRQVAPDPSTAVGHGGAEGVQHLDEFIVGVAAHPERADAGGDVNVGHEVSSAIVPGAEHTRIEHTVEDPADGSVSSAGGTAGGNPEDGEA